VDGNLQVISFSGSRQCRAGGSINSFVAEMCKWFLLQLNHGKFSDRAGRLFRRSAIARDVVGANDPCPSMGVKPARSPRAQPFSRLWPRLGF